MMTFFIAAPAARFFPAAEDILKEEGIDPAVLASITDREFHVGTRDLKEFLYHTFNYPLFLIQLQNALSYNIPSAAYATPALIKAVINFRIAGEILSIRRNNITDTHNTSLYLDAKFRSEAAPSMDRMQAAAKEAYEKMLPHLADDENRESFIRYMGAFRALLQEDETLLPLASCLLRGALRNFSWRPWNTMRPLPLAA